MTLDPYTDYLAALERVHQAHALKDLDRLSDDCLRLAAVDDPTEEVSRV